MAQTVDDAFYTLRHVLEEEIADLDHTAEGP